MNRAAQLSTSDFGGMITPDSFRDHRDACVYSPAQLVEQYKTDPAKCAEADQWNDGEQSGAHYSELESAMADLHFCDPSDLMGSDLLARLYRLAKVHGLARLAQFERMAEQEANA